MKKKATAFLLAAVLVSTFSLSNFPVFAKSDNKYVHGKISSKFVFEESETENATKWLENAKKTGEEFIESEISETSDSDKLKFLNEVLSESKRINIKQMFKKQNNGSSSFEFQIPSLKIVMDGNISANVDKNGYFYFANPTIGRHKVEIYFKDKLIKTEEIDITNENLDSSKNGNSHKDINLDISSTSTQIKEGIKNMGQSMAKAQTTFLPSWFGYSSSDFGTYNSSTRRYSKFQPVKLGSTYFSMYFVTPTGIVGCNKADETLSSAQDFPDDTASDCEKSVAFGALALGSPILAAYYYNSINCAIEVIQNMGDGNESNVYCNGKNDNGNYNCSWFNGIGHDQRLHTEDGSSTVYY